MTFEVDPGIDGYFVTTPHDDDRGVGRAYAFFEDISTLRTAAQERRYVALFPHP